MTSRNAWERKENNALKWLEECRLEKSIPPLGAVITGQGGQAQEEVKVLAQRGINSE